MRAYAVMLPQLQAEESLRAIEVVSYPHYSGDKHHRDKGNRIRKSISDRLMRLARGIAGDSVNVLRGSAAVKGWLAQNVRGWSNI